MGKVTFTKAFKPVDQKQNLHELRDALEPLAHICKGKGYRGPMVGFIWRASESLDAEVNRYWSGEHNDICVTNYASLGEGVIKTVVRFPGDREPTALVGELRAFYSKDVPKECREPAMAGKTFL